MWLHDVRSPTYSPASPLSGDILAQLYSLLLLCLLNHRHRNKTGNAKLEVHSQKINILWYLSLWTHIYVDESSTKTQDNTLHSCKFDSNATQRCVTSRSSGCRIRRSYFAAGMRTVAMSLFNKQMSETMYTKNKEQKRHGPKALLECNHARV